MSQGFYYLALPYQGTEVQQAQRTELSLRVTVECLRQGIYLFAPLNYVNHIADRLDLPPLADRRDIVMPYLFEFLKVSKGMILITAEGWETSLGVQQELAFCQQNHIEVCKVSPQQIEEDLPGFLGQFLEKTQAHFTGKTV